MRRGASVRVHDDGSIAVTLEWTAATVRAVRHVPDPEERPAYTAVAQVTRISDTVCKMSGLCGDISRGHVWLLAQALKAEGFRVLYAERTDAHIAPMATHVQDGDFAGHWRIDLDAMVERRRSRGA